MTTVFKGVGVGGELGLKRHYRNKNVFLPIYIHILMAKKKKKKKKKTTGASLIAKRKSVIF